MIFHGYQEFSLRKDGSAAPDIAVLDIDESLKKKRDLLASYFTPGILKNRTLADFGANSGFFCFWAINQGADRAFAIDMDEDYLAMIRRAKSRYGYDNLEAVRSNIDDWAEPNDIVLALALVHWIYSCTATFGDLDRIVERFAAIAKYMLVIEWVEPDDPAIDFFHHLDWNEKAKRGPYTLEAFRDALSRHFARYECIGSVSPTRKLFVAYHSPYDIDLGGPLPILQETNTIISRRCLVEYGGKQYWSCVYDGGDVVFKQATRELAEHEAAVLTQANRTDGGYFPKLLDLKSDAESSVLKLEKVRGDNLCEPPACVTASQKSFHSFVQHCLNVLDKLREAGIEHRDIRPDNIIIRNGQPVLIDFGWAISETSAFMTPACLNSQTRPADGTHCDVYSMGRVLGFVNRHKYPKFDLVIELMTEEDRLARITDVDCLRQLFNAIAADGESRLFAKVEEGQPSAIERLLMQSQRHRTLLAAAQTLAAEQSQTIQAVSAERDRTVEAISAERDRTVAAISAERDEAVRAISAERDRTVQAVSAERNEAVQALTAQLAAITNSKAWKVATLFRKARIVLIPPNSLRSRVARRLVNVVRGR
ncbi:MAG: hypothetical protein ABFC96_02590 [Thermoguttaceae bacterium]